MELAALILLIKLAHFDKRLMHSFYYISGGKFFDLDFIPVGKIINYRDKYIPVSHFLYIASLFWSRKIF